MPKPTKRAKDAGAVQPAVESLEKERETAPRSPPKPFATDSARLSELTRWHVDAHRMHLLKVTLDQLRTLLLLHRFGSPFHVARRLEGREQSSVQSQITTLNEYFAEIAGEVLALPNGRGKPYVFTKTGEAVAQWAAEILDALDSGLSRHAQRAGKQLVIAATAFTVPLAGHIIHLLRQEVDVDLQVRQVRTKEWFDVLRDGRANLVFAAVLAPGGRPRIPEDLAFIPAAEAEPAALLTNLSPTELPGDSLDPIKLLQFPVILPEAGIIMELLEEVYQGNVTDLKRCDPMISDIYYGINVLRYGLAHATMLVLHSAGKWATRPEATPMYANAPPSVPLRLVRLTGRFESAQVCAGLFARKSDLDELGEQHPLRVFWRLFQNRVDATLGRAH